MPITVRTGISSNLGIARAMRASALATTLSASDRVMSSLSAAQTFIAEIGLDMTQFPTTGHLAWWAKLSPRANQSGANNRSCRVRQLGPRRPVHRQVEDGIEARKDSSSVLATLRLSGSITILAFF